MSDNTEAVAADTPVPAPSEAPQPGEQAEAPRMYDAAYVDQLRKENASWRTKLRTVEEAQAKNDGVMKALAAAMGFGDDIAPDPARLQETLTAREAEIRRLKTDGALSEALAKHKAHPKLTRALLAADGALDSLDPSSADFADQLDAAVQAAVEDNPSLRTGQVPSRSSGEFAGGSSAPRQLTQDDIQRMTPEQIVEAQDKGLLDKLTGRI